MTKTVSIIGTRGYPSYYGGFETAVRFIAPYLAENGWTPTVYGRPANSANSSSERDSRVISKQTSGLETKSLSTLSYGFTSVLSTFWEKPNVALVMNVANGFWLPLLKLRGIPTAVNVDGIEWERAKWNKFAKLVFRAGAWMTAKFADEIIVDSEEIGEYWRREFNRKGIFIPYGGREPQFTKLQPKLIEKQYILYVARFVPENSILEFIEAARNLSKRWQVVLVGSSGYGDQIESKVQELVSSSENIFWLGHISDENKLDSLWSHAGVYFHGHTVGGTNPALVQAMACGAEIVARDTVYNREVLSESAYFVGSTPLEIQEAIAHAISQKSNNRESNLARARNFYSWDLVCEKYNSLLMGLVRPK